MIDPKLFTVERLLAAMLEDDSGNFDIWRKQAEIIPNYMPPYPRLDTRPTCVVRFEKVFLRYSKGPGQRQCWDCYGDDYLTPELALLGLLKAPVPPGALKADVWEKHRSACARCDGKG